MRILLTEDDRDMNRIVAMHLESEGFTVDACTDARRARQLLMSARYDVAIMDVLLPPDNGLDVVRSMREAGLTTPVLLLTALDAIEDRVRGLDAGADDYLVKPFALEELSARVRALSRRVTENKQNVYRVADLTLDIQKRSVTRGGREIELSMREFAILEYLMRNAGIVLTRDQIERTILSYDYAGASNIVEVYISGLRRKIDAGNAPKLIRTVRSLGYTIREPQA